MNQSEGVNAEELIKNMNLERLDEGGYFKVIYAP